jgi:hypothetical protein
VKIVSSNNNYKIYYNETPHEWDFTSKDLRSADGDEIIPKNVVNEELDSKRYICTLIESPLTNTHFENKKVVGDCAVI